MDGVEKSCEQLTLMCHSRTREDYSKEFLDEKREKFSKLLKEHHFYYGVAGAEDFNLALEAMVDAFVFKRGILAIGEAGVGKTTFMEALHNAYVGYPTSWIWCKNDEHLECIRDKPSHYYPRYVFVDDIGTEAIHFENDIVGDFIQRYHHSGEKRFFGTSNLDAEGLDAKYGGRVLDRLLQMCVILKFRGKSKRERIIIK